MPSKNQIDADEWKEPIYECDCCGGDIYDGDTYYSVDNGDKYCDSCCAVETAESIAPDGFDEDD